MHLTYVSAYDPFDPDCNSGTAYSIAKSLQQTGIELQHMYVPEANTLLPPFQEFLFRCKQFWIKYYKRAALDSELLSPRARQIATALAGPLLNHKTDAILTTLSPLSVAFLKANVPIVYWTDSTYASLISCYPQFRFHHPDTMWDAHDITNACLQNASILIFSTQWAARSAVELYGIAKHKVHVVPFGPNLDIEHSYDDVKKMLSARAQNCIKFLFVGKNWYRKGGDIVLTIVKALHQAGHAVELTIVGCTPDETPLPPFVKCIGMLSKKNPTDITKLKMLYQETHFLFVPSRAEAFGIVFCEANAFAVPCITTYVGGIAEVVKDNINGMTFSLEATIKEYCDYIVNLMNNKTQYEALALSSFNEYQTRLNWSTASHQVKKIIAENI